MDDVISRQAAIDAVRQHKANVLGERKWDEGIAYGYEAAHEHICEVLAVLPFAQPDFDEWCTDCKEYDQKKHCCPRFNRVIRNALKDAQPERKRGKWIKETLVTTNYLYKCSACKKYSRAMYDFCPNCGAFMNGEESENE